MHRNKRKDYWKCMGYKITGNKADGFTVTNTKGLVIGKHPEKSLHRAKKLIQAIIKK